MNTTNTIEQDNIREEVRRAYGAIAESTNDNDAADTRCGCGCGSGDGEAASRCCGADSAPGTHAALLGYSAEEQAAAPEGANLGLGCGNPVALASIRPGETVLDLGSGAGFDCFIAARQLGGSGRVIGVDMTPAMVAKARRNATRAGYANVEFRLGEIEALPVADASVDLVISNCVINLSPDKPRVFREAFRVLKPGGRLSIADVVARQPLPEAWRTDPAKLTGCVGGAETTANLEQWLAEAGFVNIRITPREQSRALIDSWGEENNLGSYVVSSTIEGLKP